MKKLLFFTAVLFAAVSFSACSDDNDDNLPITPANIAGTWQIIRLEGSSIHYNGNRYNYSDDFTDVLTDEYDGWTYTFNTNGTCIRKGLVGSSHFDYIYYIHGNTLLMQSETKDSNYDFLNFVGIIKKLTDSHLVIFRSGTDENRKYEKTETYKRLK